MSLSQKLHATTPTWQKTLAHPFVVGLGNGNLPLEKFQSYLWTDYIFLREYSRVLAVATAKAPDLDTMGRFAQLLDATLNQEMALHRAFAAECGISAETLAATQAAPTTLAYTNHLVRVAALGDLAAIVSAVLPCQWGYWEIGEHLARRGAPVHAPLYAEWVGMYSSEEFRDLAIHLRTLTDGLGGAASPAEQAAMETAYVTSLRLEYQFWDMAWKLEQWPV